MAEVADFLLGFGYKLVRFAPHAKHASTRRRELSSREVEAIRAIYLASANEALGKIDVSRSLLHKALMLDQAGLATVLQFEERQIG